MLHVNRLSDEKRVDVLLDAVARMKTNAHIALVSTGPAEAELRAQVEALHIGDRVSFLGFVRDDDLLALRQAADLFVIPSEADLQSLATMEAMACGLPVIAANSYALPELVHHEENGLLFTPGASDELAAQMDMLLSDAERRVKMGQMSLQIISEHDRVKILGVWEDLYRRLSMEFKEMKVLRQHLRTAQMYPGYMSEEVKDVKRPRIRRTGDLGFDHMSSPRRTRNSRQNKPSRDK